MRGRMVKRIRKNILWALVAAMILGNTMPVRAGGWSIYVPRTPLQRMLVEEEFVTSEPGHVYTYNFTIQDYPELRFDKMCMGNFKRQLMFELNLEEWVGVHISIYKDGKSYDEPIYISESDDNWEDNWYVHKWSQAEPGDYTIKVEYEGETVYHLLIYYTSYWAKEVTDDIVITKGYTAQLPIAEGATVEETTSYDKDVVDIDFKTGVIKAKKTGKTGFYMYLSNDVMYNISIKVVPNKKVHAKPESLYKAGTNRCGIEAYEAGLDKNGNLVVKAAILNNTSKKIKKDTIKMTVRDTEGKLIGTCTHYKKGVSVPAHSVKYLTFTIKKSALKQKKADFRRASISFSKLPDIGYETYSGSLTLPYTGVTIKTLDNFNNNGVEHGLAGHYCESKEEVEAFQSIDENLYKVAEGIRKKYGSSAQFINWGFELTFYYNSLNEIPPFALCSVKDGYVLMVWDTFKNTSDKTKKNRVECNQDVLLTMLAAISANPEKLYDGIYDMVYGKKLYNYNEWHTFGDSKACFVKEVSEDEESLIGQSDIMIYIKQK